MMADHENIVKQRLYLPLTRSNLLLLLSQCLEIGLTLFWQNSV